MCLKIADPSSNLDFWSVNAPQDDTHTQNYKHDMPVLFTFVSSQQCLLFWKRSHDEGKKQQTGQATPSRDNIRRKDAQTGLLLYESFEGEPG